MANKIVGNTYRYNGPGYLDNKIQPVETIDDLNKILLRQRFEGLTVTVLHPEGENSTPVDYWLVQDPNDEPGILMWVRKDAGLHTVVDTQTPEHIEIVQSGKTFYVNTTDHFDKFEKEVSEKFDKVGEKDTEQDAAISEISEWHIEKVSGGTNASSYALVDGSGNTIGDTIDIIDEQYLDDVIYIKSATEDDKEIDSEVIVGDPYLKFVWKYDIITYVAIKDWVNDYFAGFGINISSDHEISVRLADVDENNQNYLSVNEDGLKLNIEIDIDEV